MKLRLHAGAGAREAWLVDPETRTVEARDLASGARQALVGSRALPGFAARAGALLPT